MADCCLYFPRLRPPIKPLVCARPGTKPELCCHGEGLFASSHAAWPRGRAHAHARAHTPAHKPQHCSVLFCQRSPLFLPQPPCPFKHWPLIASSSSSSCCCRRACCCHYKASCVVDSGETETPWIPSEKLKGLKKMEEK